MKNVLKHLVIIGIFICFATPAFAAKFISVRVDNANVRTGPSKNKPVKMELFSGYPLKVLDTSGEWYHIVDFEGDKGWIHKSIVQSQNSVIVTAKDFMNMRSQPSKTAKVIANVDRGVVLKVIKKQGSWLKVRHRDGVEGWMYASLLWPR